MALTRQPTITSYLSGTPSRFENITEDIWDKYLTTEERVLIYKTLAYNFFDDQTFVLVYYTKMRRIPPFEQVCAQFGFMNCANAEERLHLLMIYKTCFENCYPDLFVFKPLAILYDYFKEDRIADFILYSYGRIHHTDSHFYWFLNRQDIVKHNQNYQEIMEKKANLFKSSKQMCLC